MATIQDLKRQEKARLAQVAADKAAALLNSKKIAEAAAKANDQLKAQGNTAPTIAQHQAETEKILAENLAAHDEFMTPEHAERLIKSIGDIGDNHAKGVRSIGESAKQSPVHAVLVKGIQNIVAEENRSVAATPPAPTPPAPTPPAATPPAPTPPPTPLINAAPVVVDDNIATAHNTAVEIDVVANDTDANTDRLTVESFDGASANGGTVESNALGSLRYTPKAGFSGDDTFTYAVKDIHGAVSSARATVTVTVGAAPTGLMSDVNFVAAADWYTLAEWYNLIYATLTDLNSKIATFKNATASANWDAEIVVAKTNPYNGDDVEIVNTAIRNLLEKLFSLIGKAPQGIFREKDSAGDIVSPLCYDDSDKYRGVDNTQKGLCQDLPSSGDLTINFLIVSTQWIGNVLPKFLSLLLEAQVQAKTHLASVPAVSITHAANELEDLHTAFSSQCTDITAVAPLTSADVQAKVTCSGSHSIDFATFEV